MVLVGFQFFGSDTCLAFGTLFPTGAGSFVTADVDVFGREYVNDFGHDIFEELHGLFVADAQHIFEYAPTWAHFIRSTGTSHFGIGGQCGKHVSGQVYFGDDRDIALPGIFYDFFGLLLRIETAIPGVVILFGVPADNGTVAPGANFRQLGILLYFYSPALVFGEVPVEGIHIVKCQQVYVFFYELNGKEVAAHIEVHASVAEAGFILDAAGRQ